MITGGFLYITGLEFFFRSLIYALRSDKQSRIDVSRSELFCTTAKEEKNG